MGGPRQTVRVWAAITMAAALAGCGLTAPRGNEGFADLDSLGALDVDSTMTLSIGPRLLRFAARHVDDEPEVQQLLRELDGVRVRTYEIDGDAERVAARMEKMALKLRAQDWEPVALLREEGEQAHMLIKASGGRILGLTVLATDDYEAVIVNVMGDLRPELFHGAMAALDVDTPTVRVAAVN